MIGFKDMTFCLAQTCSHWGTCQRALTEEVKKEGERWWGSPDFPVAVVNQLDCYEEIQ